MGLVSVRFVSRTMIMGGMWPGQRSLKSLLKLKDEGMKIQHKPQTLPAVRVEVEVPGLMLDNIRGESWECMTG